MLPIIDRWSVKSLTFMLTLLLAGVPSLVTRADFVYESFDYPSGDSLTRKNGGTGFANAWAPGGYNAQYSMFQISPGSLSYKQLATSGNSVYTNTNNALNGIVRTTLQSFMGDGLGTRFLSFLIQRENNGVDGGFGGLYIDGTQGDLFVGKGGQYSVWGMEERGGGGAVLSNIQAQFGETAFMVLKMESNGTGQDQFTLYVNPTPGQGEPGSGLSKSNFNVGTADKIVLYNGGLYTFDEIRIGDTFEAVTPTISSTPEPSTILLGALGLSPLLASRMRRRFCNPMRKFWVLLGF